MTVPVSLLLKCTRRDANEKNGKDKVTRVCAQMVCAHPRQLYVITITKHPSLRTRRMHILVAELVW